MAAMIISVIGIAAMRPIVDELLSVLLLRSSLRVGGT